MSLSTADTRLTRTQSSQMPALLEFYSPSAVLLDLRPRAPARGVIWTVATLFAGCAAAAGLIPVDKVVTAQGKVVATESTIAVQPFEASIVRELPVQEGQVVHKGDLLARLDPTFTTSDKTVSAQQVASLKAEVERLRAESTGADYHASVPDAAGQMQEAIYTQRRAERSFRLENYRQKIDGLLATLSKSIGDVQSFTDRTQVATVVEGKRLELEKLGIGSQLTRLQATDQRMSMQSGLQNAQQAAKTAAGDLAAMRADAAAYDEQWHAKVSQELLDQGRKLDEAEGNLAKANLKSNLVEFRAPQDAVVFSRAPVSVGSVLQSGDQFLKLVPLNVPLEVEASVAGTDAGFVHVGDKVTVKFDTFPFAQYGAATGDGAGGQPRQLHQPAAAGTNGSRRDPVCPGRAVR